MCHTLSVTFMSLLLVTQCLSRCPPITASGDDRSDSHSSCESWNHILTCDYNCTVNTAEFTAGQHRAVGMAAVLRSATRLHVTDPACWGALAVYNSYQVELWPQQDDVKVCPYTITANDSHILDLHHDHITSLELIDSFVDHINLQHLHLINLSNTTVSTIDQMKISPSLVPSNIHSSVIRDLHHLHLSGTVLNISGCVLNTISTGSITVSEGSLLIIEHTIIHSLAMRALTVASGSALILRNVTISSCAEEALDISQGSVELREFTVIRRAGGQQIVKAYGPGDVSASNVRIEGLLLEEVLDYVAMETQAKQTFETYFIDFQGSYCSRYGDKNECNYKGLDKLVKIDTNALPFEVNTSITNAAQFDARGDFSCSDTFLSNVSGNMFSSPTHHSSSSFFSSSPSSCPGVGSVSVSSSSMSSLSLESLRSVELLDSSVTRLSLSSVSDIRVERSFISGMVQSNITGRVNMHCSKVLAVHHSTTMDVLTVTGSVVENVMNWTLHSSSLMSNSTLSFSPTPFTPSLIIVKGTLTLSSIRFLRFPPQSIYLHPLATLILDDVHLDSPQYGAIFASSRDQVKVLPALDGSVASLPPMIVYEYSDAEDESHRTDRTPFPETISPNKPDCWATHQALYCNFTGDSEIPVMVNTTEPDIIISGAWSITIEPAQNQRVTVYDAKSLKVLSQTPFYLHLTSTSLHQPLSTALHALTVQSSVLPDVHLNPAQQLQQLQSVSSTITSLAAYAQFAYFESTKMSSLASLNCPYLEMNECTVEAVEQMGLVVSGPGTIDNSKLGRVTTGGVTVSGDLELRNVTIGTAGAGAITVLPGATLKLSHVTIHRADPHTVFNIKDGGSVISVDELVISDVRIISLPQFNIYYPINKAVYQYHPVMQLYSYRPWTAWVAVGVALTSLIVVSAVALFSLRYVKRRSMCTEGRVLFRTEDGVVMASEGTEQQDDDVTQHHTDSSQDSNEKTLLMDAQHN